MNASRPTATVVRTASATGPTPTPVQPHTSESAAEKTVYTWEVHANTFPVPVIPTEQIINPKSEPGRDTSVSLLDLLDKVQSSTFIRGQGINRPSEWQLYLRVRNTQEAPPKSPEIELVLICKKIFAQANVPIWARITYEIIDESGSPLKSTVEVGLKHYREGTLLVMPVGTKPELQSKQAEYFPDGILRFRLRINIYKELTRIQNAAAEDDSKPPAKRRRLDSPSEMSLTGLLGSLDNLWTTREQSGNVTIKCLGHPIKAHKFILSSRSSVWMAMLDSQMETKEKTTNEIEVDDITPEIMNALLEFLYLGDSMQFDWANIDNICALVYAAEKYFVVPLMNKCYQALAKMMNLENFWKIAKTAFLYESGKEFKNEVRHFYECHQITLNGIRSFRTFAQENFDEFYKLFFYRITD